MTITHFLLLNKCDEYNRPCKARSHLQMDWCDVTDSSGAQAGYRVAESCRCRHQLSV